MVTIFGVAEGDPEAVELTEEDSSAETHVSEDPQSNKQKKTKIYDQKICRRGKMKC